MYITDNQSMYMYFNTRRIGRICRCWVNMIKQQGEEFYNLPDIVSWKLKKFKTFIFECFYPFSFLFIFFPNTCYTLSLIPCILIIGHGILKKCWKCYSCAKSCCFEGQNITLALVHWLEDQTKSLWEPLATYLF